MASEYLSSFGPKPHGVRKDYDVFICHASAEYAPGCSGKALAGALAIFLRLLGFKPWLDRLDIETAHHNQRAIERGLARCRVILPLVTQWFYRSNWSQKEAFTGFQWGLEVLPAFHASACQPNFDVNKQRGLLLPAEPNSRFSRYKRGTFVDQLFGKWLCDLSGVSNFDATSDFAGGSAVALMHSFRRLLLSHSFPPSHGVGSGNRL